MFSLLFELLCLKIIKMKYFYLVAGFVLYWHLIIFYYYTCIGTIVQYKYYACTVRTHWNFGVWCMLFSIFHLNYNSPGHFKNSVMSDRSQIIACM